MIWTDIKLKLAGKKYRKQKNSVGKKPVKIGVIIDSETAAVQQPFLELNEEFNLEEKEFRMMICKTRGVKNDIFETPCFTLEDLKWNGTIDHSEVVDFLEQEYELLISFAAAENKLAGFLVSNVFANLKVGREQDKQRNFDFVVETNQDEPEIFLEELKKYNGLIKRQYE